MSEFLGVLWYLLYFSTLPYSNYIFELVEAVSAYMFLTIWALN